MPWQPNSLPEKSPTARKASARVEQPYHHGALDQALLQAAETVLERDGLQGPDACARWRGRRASHTQRRRIISVTSPALSANSRQSAFAGSDKRWVRPVRSKARGNEKAMARARAYVTYAKNNPGMYGLMFRIGAARHDPSGFERSRQSVLCGPHACDRCEAAGRDRRRSPLDGPGRGRSHAPGRWCMAIRC